MSHDEFGEIGWAFSAAEERSLRTSAPPPQDDPSPGSKGMGLLMALAGIIVVLLVAQSLPGTVQRAELPSVLAGMWVPQDTTYDDRSLEFTAETVILGMGEGRRSTHPLRAVIERESVVTRVFEVHYASTQGVQSMEVHLHPDGTIRLRNPSDIVWRRE